MKYFVIIISMAFALLITANTSHAQRVMATSGGTYSSAEHDISWTIGEALTSTIENANLTLTQGVHQPTLSVTGIFEAKNTQHLFAVYPNPVEQKLTVDIGNYEHDFKIRIMSNTGSMVLNESYLNDFKTTSIDVEKYIQGIYYLHILNNADAVMQSFKIIKL